MDGWMEGRKEKGKRGKSSLSWPKEHDYKCDSWKYLLCKNHLINCSVAKKTDNKYCILITQQPTFSLQREPLISGIMDPSLFPSQMLVLSLLISHLFGEEEDQVNQFWSMKLKKKPAEFEKRASFLWKKQQHTKLWNFFPLPFPFCLQHLVWGCDTWSSGSYLETMWR